MANSNKLPAVALVLAAASLAAVLLLCSTQHTGVNAAARVVAPALPFSPMDVLPLLPRRVAMAALRALRGASDIFPVFVGAATAGGPSGGGGAHSDGRLEWKGACFYDNEAWLELHNNSGSRYGGGTLHIKVRLATTAFPVPFVLLQFASPPVLCCPALLPRVCYSWNDLIMITQSQQTTSEKRRQKKFAIAQNKQLA